MIVDIILGVFLGFLFGLIPTLHINFVSQLFLALGLFLVFPDKFYFFLSLSIAQQITSYLPQTFFSVPNSENIMNLFPLHRLFLKGKALEALFLTFLGSFLGSIFAILLLPFLYLLFSSLLGFNYFISFAIIFTLFSFIYFEKSLKDKLIVIFIIFSSGLLGLLTLKYNVFLKQPLFVSVVGLFTIPMLVKSIFEKKEKVYQETNETEIKVNTKKSLFLSFVGALSSLLIILVPSFSSSQASTIISRIKRNLSSKEYLLIYSSVSISALIFSFFLAMFFYKPRLGYVAILLLENQIPPRSEVVLFVLTILISVSLIILILKSILKGIIFYINKIDLNKINKLILLFSIVFVVFISGFKALPILFLSAVIGYLPLHYKKSRVILMAYLMIPTLLFYI